MDGVANTTLANQFSGRYGTANPKAVKRVANQMAEYLFEFVARLEAEIPIYGDGLNMQLILSCG